MFSAIGVIPLGGWYDLIVSGAYSRSRQSERIFGGVTREILAADQMSWLFAH